MTNEFPTSPEVLAEASPVSLAALALMSPEEMGPTGEMAYIRALQELRERYERALGAGRAKPAKGAGSGSGSGSGSGARSAAAAKVVLGGAFGEASTDEEGLF